MRSAKEEAEDSMRSCKRYLWVELTDVMTFLTEVEELRKSTKNKMLFCLQMATEFKHTRVDFTALVATIRWQIK